MSFFANESLRALFESELRALFESELRALLESEWSRGSVSWVKPFMRWLSNTAGDLVFTVSHGWRQSPSGRMSFRF
ncbi:MAG: hypothetical protein CBE43_10250 [Rhodopirellula sp. TMED283]|nr:MAG: hypothetical protein CBE43_10250 [Rhodopirellula sp. TMED283]